MRFPEPAVTRQSLIRTAGITWMLVGLLLSARALFWFGGVGARSLWFAVPALAIGYAKGRYVFSRLARQNIQRIRELSPHKERICIFAFQAMKSYLLIIGMITLGILLRLSPLPREWLGLVYLAIGSGLSYASIQYLIG